MTTTTPRLRTANLAHLLTATARRFPDQPAVVHGDRTVTWGRLDAAADAVTATLRDRGVGHEDVVLVYAPNCPDVIAVQFGVLRAGAVYAPVNDRLTPHEVAELAAVCRPRMFLCHQDAAAEYRDAATPALTFGGEPRPGADHLGDPYAAAVPAADPPAAWRGDPAMLLFTSGTSGRPKAAVLTHDQLAYVVTNQLSDVLPGLDHTHVSLVIAPLSHGAGIHLLAQIARGARSVLTTSARLDADEVWRLVEQHRVTNLFTVPTILNRLVRSPALDHRDHASLRHVIYSGAPLAREDQRYALARLGPVLVQHYGLVEVTANITVLPPAAHGADQPEPVDTCGLERTGMQVSIQDPRTGAPLPLGTEGEVCVCGPAVFAGYYRDENATAAAFRDGWFRTGDRGFLDARGFLHLTGRTSDMYISGGSNIHPREIEDTLRGHPAVLDTVAFGVPDPEWGESGRAVCVTGTDVSPDELRTWLRDQLARYKVPKRLYVWPELPVAGTGKVDRKEIRKTIIALEGGERVRGRPA